MRKTTQEVAFEARLASDRLYAYHSLRALGLGKEERTAT